MWLSLWITVAFGVGFLLVEILFNRPLPLGVGVIPTAVTSIATNGWEAFWHFRFHTVGRLCVDAEARNCWASDFPDYSRPPEPPGWMQAILPWFGEQTFWGWLVTNVPMDLAATALAGALVWSAFRVFGYHGMVEHHLNPLD